MRRFRWLLLLTGLCAVALVVVPAAGAALPAPPECLTDTYCPPPPPPPPPPGTPDYAPYGWHGDITPDGYIRGWACDPNDFNYPIDVHFYANNGRGTHVYMGSDQAWDWWNEGVAGVCGGNPWHGYYFRIPDWIRNGETWQVYSYAINICGSSCYQGNPQQSGDGALFSFGTLAGWNDEPDTPAAAVTSSFYGTDATNCANVGTVRRHTLDTAIGRGLGPLKRKARIYVVWCSNAARTKIINYTAHTYPQNGGWCHMNSGYPSKTVVDGGIGSPYVDIQFDANGKCSTPPWNWPEYGFSLMVRYRFKAASPYVQRLAYFN